MPRTATERRGCEILQTGRQGDARPCLVCLLLSQLFLGHFSRNIGANRIETAVERFLIDVVEEHVETRTRADVRDAVAHGSGPKNCDGFCVRHRDVSDDFRV